MQLVPSLDWKEQYNLNQHQFCTETQTSHWTQNLRADVVLTLIEKGRVGSTHVIEVVLGEFSSKDEMSIYFKSLKKTALFRDSDKIDNFSSNQNGWLAFHEKLADPQATIANLAKDLREQFGVRVEVVEQTPVESSNFSGLGQNFLRLGNSCLNKDKIKQIEFNASSPEIQNGVRIYWDDDRTELWGKEEAAELCKTIEEGK